MATATIDAFMSGFCSHRWAVKRWTNFKSSFEVFT